MTAPPPFQVGAEIPMDSEEADEENQNQDGKTLLSIFKRGCVHRNVCPESGAGVGIPQSS